MATPVWARAARAPGAMTPTAIKAARSATIIRLTTACAPRQASPNDRRSLPAPPDHEPSRRGADHTILVGRYLALIGSISMTSGARRHRFRVAGADGGCGVPSSHAQPPRGRDQSVPTPACEQSGRLDAVGRRCAGASEAARPADLPVDRLRGVPLVPCHGARIVRGRVDCPPPERPVRVDQGRPRGAARPRFDLHGRRPGDDGEWRLADVGVPDP